MRLLVWVVIIEMWCLLKCFNNFIGLKVILFINVPIRLIEWTNKAY